MGKPAGITPGHALLLLHCANGWTAEEIAAAMGPGHTAIAVRSQLRRLYVKMGARNIAHAVSLAHRWRVITPKDFPQ